MKLRMNANTNVTRNHANLPPKYLRYLFNVTPPYRNGKLPNRLWNLGVGRYGHHLCPCTPPTFSSFKIRMIAMFLNPRNMAILYYFLWVDQLNIIETCNAPTIHAVKWWNRGIGTIILRRESCPNRLVHGMEGLRSVHQREGRNIGQVDLD